MSVQSVTTVDQSRLQIILGTYISFCVVHCCRRSFASVKMLEVNTHRISIEDAASVDYAFMLTYAIGMVICGNIADSCRASVVLSLSLLGTGIAGLWYASLMSSSAVSMVPVICATALSAISQSASWPCCVRLFQLTNCGPFGAGLWGTSGTIGNIVSSLSTMLLFSVVHTIHDQIFAGFAFPGALAIMLAVLCFVYLPAETEIYTPVGERDRELVDPNQSEVAESVFARFRSVVRIKGIVENTLCLTIVKGVSYSIFFWFPFYLSTVYKLEPSRANVLTSMYDVGMLCGAPLLGRLISQLANEAASPERARTAETYSVMIFCCLASIPLALVTSDFDLNNSVFDESMLGVILFAIGALIGGVMTILTTATCMRLGGKSSTGSVTGFIDGFASFGAAFAQVLISNLVHSSGWSAVFHYMSGAAIISVIPLAVSLI